MKQVKTFEEKVESAGAWGMLVLALEQMLRAVTFFAKTASDVGEVAQKHSQKWLDETQAELEKARKEFEEEFNYE